MTTPAADVLIDTLGYDFPWRVTATGASLNLPDGEHEVRVREEDDIYRLVVLSGGRAKLTHTEVTFSGVLGHVALLATIDALVTELA